MHTYFSLRSELSNVMYVQTRATISTWKKYIFNQHQADSRICPMRGQEVFKNTNGQLTTRQGHGIKIPPFRLKSERASLHKVGPPHHLATLSRHARLPRGVSSEASGLPGDGFTPEATLKPTKCGSSAAAGGRGGGGPKKLRRQIYAIYYPAKP